jgi:hypothetical protein
VMYLRSASDQTLFFVAFLFPCGAAIIDSMNNRLIEI